MPSPGSAPAATVARAQSAGGAPVHPLVVVAGFGGVAGLVAAVIRTAIGFDHGIWLVAYLVLVGFLAPTLLCRGERRVLAQPGPDQGARLVAALWLAGVIAVPAGVLGQARVLVCAGAVCLLAALVLLVDRAYAGGATPAPERSRTELTAHGLTIAVMTVSTGIGVLLAWSYPWF